MAIHKDTVEIEYLYTTKDFKKLGLKRNFKIPIPLIKSEKSISEDKSLMIRGYASTADKDRVDDVITIDALKKSKNDLMQPGSKTVFYNHDRSMPIGKVVKTEMDHKGLIVNVQISKADDVKDIRTKIKEGVLNSFSIGGRFKKVQVERDEENRITSFKVLELELFEVSVVGIPCNPKASVTDVIEKSFKPLIRKEKIMAKEKELTDEEKKIAADKAAEELKNKPLNATEVQKLIDAAINPVKKSMEDGLAGIQTAIKAIVPVKVEEKKEGKVEDKDMPEWAKKLNEQVASLQDTITKGSTRKGRQVEEEEEEEEEEVDEVPEKALKDANDPKSAAFVKHIMIEDPDMYAKLGDNEKKIASAIYFELMKGKINKKS